MTERWSNGTGESGCSVRRRVGQTDLGGFGGLATLQNRKELARQRVGLVDVQIAIVEAARIAQELCGAPLGHGR